MCFHFYFKTYSLYEHILLHFYLEWFSIYRKVAKEVQRAPMCTQFPLLLMSYDLRQYDTFVTTNEPILICYCKLKFILYLDFLFT